MQRVGALVLAAGKGTRMHSPKPKVLQTMIGEPLLWYVYRALEGFVGDRIWTVVGFGADQVKSSFQARSSRFVFQEKQLGTGHALQVAWPRLIESGIEHVIILNGDVPCVPKSIVADIVSEHIGKMSDLTIATTRLEDPGPYGRVFRDISGRIKRIVEAKDVRVEDGSKTVNEVNVGIYMLRLGSVGNVLGGLSNENMQKEYYITDLVGLADQAGLSVNSVTSMDSEALAGVNTPIELAEVEETARKEIVSDWMGRGVVIHNPRQVWIGPRVMIESGCSICGPCHIFGESRITSGSIIDAYCHIQDAVLRACQIRPFTHIEKSSVDVGSVIGPYSRLRPGTDIGTDSRVGNFVEVKNTKLGRNSKAGHLAYLGDSVIGDDVNIGAGTITCNYDGRRKHQTRIDDGAFIGSNTALVAPVVVGSKALVGAGSTITKDVPDDSLAIARSQQKNIRRKQS
ncbi:MAG: UDP-N-acetylglucosamine diphosphorylase/glucosamine-1-phosphate N-acetyltransferase [Deltaproteobacteria bacterium]|nr:UDP-N-acetylglucosamine diphosphorylase/glucosamine-1-phosphate N-acetyltransferase [Deltaproteobacteria bacterium]